MQLINLLFVAATASAATIESRQSQDFEYKVTNFVAAVTGANGLNTHVEFDVQGRKSGIPHSHCSHDAVNVVPRQLQTFRQITCQSKNDFTTFGLERAQNGAYQVSIAYNSFYTGVEEFPKKALKKGKKGNQYLDVPEDFSVFWSECFEPPCY